MEIATVATGTRAAAEAIVDSYGRDPGFLIPMLQDLQAALGYLPREELKVIAELLDLPVSQLYAVATFYTSFSLTPRGKHLITLCLGTVCYLKGGRQLDEKLQKELGIEAGGTTADRLFTYQPVNCLGACALAPVMVIDGSYFEKVKLNQLSKIIADYRKKAEPNSRGK
jgi:NADH:ubiquinone oxidoreductase subunit E